MDWKKVYQALNKSGMSDKEIAKEAGMTRETINLVRNGNYTFAHSPSFEAGRKLEALLRVKNLEIPE